MRTGVSTSWTAVDSSRSARVAPAEEKAAPRKSTSGQRQTKAPRAWFRDCPTPKASEASRAPPHIASGSPTQTATAARRRRRVLVISARTSGSRLSSRSRKGLSLPGRPRLLRSFQPRLRGGRAHSGVADSRYPGGRPSPGAPSIVRPTLPVR
ncbi:MAG: hypothetical protein ACYTGB_04875 [Planctomycetota bacterium]